MKTPPQGNGSTKFEIHDDDMGGWVRVFSSRTDLPADFPVYLSRRPLQARTFYRLGHPLGQLGKPAFVGLIVGLSLLGAKTRAELLLARRHLYTVGITPARLRDAT
jgi:hypothetical protein